MAIKRLIPIIYTMELDHFEAEDCHRWTRFSVDGEWLVKCIKRLNKECGDNYSLEEVVNCPDLKLQEEVYVLAQKEKKILSEEVFYDKYFLDVYNEYLNSTELENDFDNAARVFTKDYFYFNVFLPVEWNRCNYSHGEYDNEEDCYFQFTPLKENA